jgi:hypothetical protein
LIFTVLVPGVIGACVPALFYRVGELKDGFWRIGWLLAGAGAAIYLMCLVAFLFSGGTPAIFFTRPLKFILGGPAKIGAAGAVPLLTQSDVCGRGAGGVRTGFDLWVSQRGLGMGRSCGFVFKSWWCFWKSRICGRRSAGRRMTSTGAKFHGGLVGLERNQDHERVGDPLKITCRRRVGRRSIRRRSWRPVGECRRSDVRAFDIRRGLRGGGRD